ncbi:hypothetical protein O3G_MSEX005151 [Manduca sexta]|uniref:Uncharacterized protein n=1 Tax=Manduca sexta TaxID=7130 RepID=A0A922CJ16_MANSE|nr:hypothetical protein O3G_MSEX005151 [Manduca sexta]
MRAMFLLLTLLISQCYSAPQFITFKEGKLGVNFGGYHAGVGLGGLLGGGVGGGLFAEAGTPHGQSARAGLGGNVDENGRTAGNLFAGATAGRSVGAAAGLGGKVVAGETGGVGFGVAEGGIHQASAGLAGETNVHGSAGITYSGTKSLAVPSTIVKETEVSVVPVENVKHKEIHKEYNVDAFNEITPVAAAGVEANVGASVNLNANAQPTAVVKEVSKWIPHRNSNRRSYATIDLQDIMNYALRVPSTGVGQTRWRTYKNNRAHQVYVEPQPVVVEKHIVHTHTKPHHVHNAAYIGGFIGAGIDAAPQPVSVHKSVGTAIQKRIDVGVESEGSIAAAAAADAHGGGQVLHTKEVTVSRNPNFFQDIFNIPISALKSVSTFLTNTAGNTGVSVQNSATIHTDSDKILPKHASSVSSSSSEAHIAIETPSASQLIDGIFSIPINTLSAVNKFLENNVPVRKRIQVTQGETEEPTRIRLGPHARRRANKRVIVLEEASNSGSQ